MRVFLFTYYYPPDPQVGAQRPAALAAALAARGHEVDVIAANINCPTSVPTIERENLRVHRVRVLRNPREVLLGSRVGGDPHREDQPSQDKATHAERVSPHRDPLGTVLKRWIFSALWLPDDRQGFIPPAISKGSKLARSSPPGWVISTGPPFSVHLAAGLFSQLKRIPWAADFRDPWTDGQKPSMVRSRVSDSLERWLERWTIRHARVILAATPTIATSLRAKLKRAHGQRATTAFLPVYNGIPTPVPDSSSRSGSVTILHAGTLYLDRDPEPFFGALERVVGSGTLSEVDIRLVFLGANTGSFRGKSLASIAEPYGIAHLIETPGHLQSERALETAARADLLLLLAQNQPDQVPSKLFDYLAARRPILAIADSQGETARLLSKFPGHLVISPSDANFRSKVTDFVARARETNTLPVTEVHHALSRENQMAKIVRLLEEVDQDPS